MFDIKLTDVIDVNELQLLQDTFSNATGMASISLDLRDDVTRPSNFNDFCMKYTRGCSEGLRRCKECDLRGGEEAKRTGRPSVYYCHAGLMDFAVPIMLNGEQIGSVIGGQVLPNPPDEEKFRQIAKELSIDPELYVEAVKKIPIVPEMRIREAAKLLGLVVQLMSDNYSKLSTLRNICFDIQGYTDSIQKTLKSFAGISDNLKNNQKSLMSEIKNITKLLVEINNVVGSVSSLADETHMISFNASIEASRAGEFGKSFTVIADEIRRLSEDSKRTMDNIQEFTEKIQKSIEKTATQSNVCTEAVKDEISQLSSLTDNVNKIRKLLDTLENIHKS